MLFEPPYRHLLVIILVGISTSILAMISYRTRPGRGNWRHLRPGASHWFALFLAEALFGFLTLMVIYSGPPETAADGQWIAFMLLWIGAASGVLLMTIQILATIRAKVAWRDRWISFRGSDGGPVVRHFSEIVSISGGQLRPLQLEFGDGERAAVDPYAAGSGELLDAISTALKVEPIWP